MNYICISNIRKLMPLSCSFTGIGTSGIIYHILPCCIIKTGFILNTSRTVSLQWPANLTTESLDPRNAQDRLCFVFNKCLLNQTISIPTLVSASFQKPPISSCLSWPSTSTKYEHKRCSIFAASSAKFSG